MARSSVFPTSSYRPPEDSLSQDITATVERTMKKYTDNVMRFLEGISSRLSQLELYCYNLDKTIGEMRSDLTRDNEEADVKLKSMEKHLQEVRRSVQILRDKQELADTQKDFAMLQLVQKDSSSPSHSQQSEEPVPPEPKKSENTSDAHNQQLALTLPHQIPPQPQPQQQQQYYNFVSSMDTGRQVCNLAWSKNVNEIVSTHGYSQNQIMLWKYPSMAKVTTRTGHIMRVLYLATSPDGQTTVTRSGYKTSSFSVCRHL
ncbi:hypothetical protein Bca52824_009194 [Brassica carinata]|uniref:Uncharacterized protein n=1 Tax=Brassica carinata TaxID=52824 RepID=A0A8X7WAL8_BRACI|nr:hypothetical protein Bca52824_009194 [Brassica carinata]